MDRVLSDPRAPHERIAAELRRQEPDGVATGTAQRAITLLSSRV
ncbi:MAG: hypothetical protein ACRDRR_16075 [Pseudonocardiaceae bacterium]